MHLFDALAVSRVGLNERGLGIVLFVWYRQIDMLSLLSVLCRQRRAKVLYSFSSQLAAWFKKLKRTSKYLRAYARQRSCGDPRIFSPLVSMLHKGLKSEDVHLIDSDVGMDAFQAIHSIPSHPWQVGQPGRRRTARRGRPARPPSPSPPSSRHPRAGRNPLAPSKAAQSSVRKRPFPVSSLFHSPAYINLLPSHLPVRITDREKNS
jgi:hypothetical protein